MHSARLRRRAARLSVPIVCVVNSVVFGTAAGAQIPQPRPEINIKLPELEVYQIKPQNDPVRAGGIVVIAIGVRNNGTASAAFDYAIGPKDRSAVWVTANGTTLAAGKVTIGGIKMTYAQAQNYFRTTLGAKNPGGFQTVCFGIFLLRDGSKDPFTDPNNANHQKEQCLKFEFPIM